MAMPISKVEVGFDTSFSGGGNFFTLNDATKGKLDDTGYPLGGLQFIDVTDRVKDFSISRGRSNLFSAFPAGQLNVSFNNHDRAFDPLYDDSPFAGNIIPRREIRVTTNEAIVNNATDTNLITNPSFEGQSTTTTTNLITNPSFETNTTGWVTSGGTLTRITTDSVFGTACASFAATAVNQLPYIDTNVTASQTYTFSIYVKAETGKSFTVVIEEKNAGGATVGAGTTGSIVGNGSWQRVGATRVFGATASFARVYVRNDTVGAHTFLLDGAMLTQTATTETYFDGNTTGVNDTTFAWTGTANNSTSTRQCNALVTARTNLFTNPNFELGTTQWAASRTTLSNDDTNFLFGSRAMRGTTNQAWSANLVYIDHSSRITTTALKTYTFSAYIFAPLTNAGDNDFQLRVFPWTGTTFLTSIGGTTVTVPRGQWTRLSVTREMPSTSIAAMLRVLVTNNIPVGDVYVVDGVLAEEGSTVGDYFDGNSPASGDYIYDWSGRVGLTASEQQVRQIVGANASTNAAAGMSREWDSTGVRSLVVAPTIGNNDSHIRFNLTGLTSGETYTALTTCRLSSPLTGTLNTYTRAISAWNSTYTTNAGSTAAPNTAGTHNLRLNFTASGTAMVVALHNGATVNNGLVWFDDFAVVQGNYTGPYFDGNSIPTNAYLSYAWGGTANASTSTRTQDAYVAGQVFNGWIDDWSYSYLPNGDSVAEAIAYDPTSLISNRLLPAGTPTVQKAGARIDYVLDQIDYLTEFSNLDTGTVDLSAYPIEVNTNAMAYLQQVAASEPGLLFFSKEGYITFVENFDADYVDEPLYLGEGGIPFQNLDVSYGSENLYNQVVIARAGGGTATATDTASADFYGLRALNAPEVLLNTDGDLANLALQLATQYSQPQYRFSSLEVAVHKLNEAEQNKILNAELGAIAQVTFTPNGIGDPIQRKVQIISINHTVNPQTHYVEFGFQPIL